MVETTRAAAVSVAGGTPAAGPDPARPTDPTDQTAPTAPTDPAGSGESVPAGPGTRAARREPRWLERLRSANNLTRFRRYTWTALCAMGLFEAALLGAWLVEGRSTLRLGTLVVLGVLCTAHTALVVRLATPALHSYLGTGPPPYRRFAALLVVTVAALVTLFVEYGLGGSESTGMGAAVAWLLMFTAGPLMLGLPLWSGGAVMLSLIGGSLLTLAALGGGQRELTATAVALVLGALSMTFAYRCSGWSLRIVEQLVSAREAEARLAVAEERLRFGRDMHDVLGRNLTVIALKSELAGQLAERGSPHAVEQMAEVQRIAQDSQRELREVVRGYREVDLQAELEGARGMLRAVGVSCRVRDDGGGRLPAATRSALGWVVREGTTNVLRHADARTCEIRMRLALTPLADAAVETGVRSPVVVLVMENDGLPAAGDRAPLRGSGPTGSGLNGLRERLAPLGGSVRTERLPQGVFRLTAEVPLSAPPPADGAPSPSASAPEEESR